MRCYTRQAANGCARRFCPWSCCYSFFTTYETAKVVKVEDCRIQSMYIFLLVLVAGYAIFHVIGGNQYCEFVTLGAVNLDQTFWWDPAGWATAVAPAKESLSRINDSNIPYCNGSLNNDYWFGSGWQYINNTCGFDLKSNHFTSKLPNGLRATTSMGVFNDKEAQTHSVIVPAVEELMMTYGLHIKARTIHEAPELYLEYDGDYHKMPECNEALNFTTGCRDNSDYIHFSLNQLLMLTGIDMDARNIGIDSQRAADTPPEFQSSWPTYRITGSTINVEIDVSNYKFAEKIQFVPGFLESPTFDDKLKARMKIVGDKSDEKVTWSCAGWTIVEYSESDDSGVGSYYTCDMRVLFSVSGSICFTSQKAIQDAIIAVCVLFGFAGILVDIIFTNLLKTFQIAKASDDKAEWMTYEKAKKYDSDKLAQKIDDSELLTIRHSQTLAGEESDLSGTKLFTHSMMKEKKMQQHEFDELYNFLDDQKKALRSLIYHVDDVTVALKVLRDSSAVKNDLFEDEWKKFDLALKTVRRNMFHHDTMVSTALLDTTDHSIDEETVKYPINVELVKTTSSMREESQHLHVPNPLLDEEDMIAEMVAEKDDDQLAFSGFSFLFRQCRAAPV